MTTATNSRGRLALMLVAVLTLAVPVQAVAQPALAPTVITRPGIALGLTAMTARGSVQPHGLHTTYYFEFGPTTAYGSKTPAAPLPP
jgi:hypothetical protein